MKVTYDCDIAGARCCCLRAWSRWDLLVLGMVKEGSVVHHYSAWAWEQSRNVEGIILEVRYLVSERN